VRPLSASDSNLVRKQAAWVACRRTNPFYSSWDYGDHCLFDFADAVIAWLERPQGAERWETVLRCREAFRDACEDGDDE
jgi:hypothetical protein